MFAQNSQIRSPISGQKSHNQMNQNLNDQLLDDPSMYNSQASKPTSSPDRKQQQPYNLSNVPKSLQIRDNLYSLTFKVYYETQMGESLAVLGNIPQLGNWKKEIIYPLKWTSGHIWESVEPLQTDVPFLMYKYALFENNKFKMMEKGIDRIADLDLLDSSESSSETKKSKQVKSIDINDEWETFKIFFSVFHPKIGQNDKIMIKCQQQLNENFADGMEMHKSIKSYNWLKQKYGDLMQPYEGLMKFSQPSQKTINEDFTFKYYYVLSDGQNQVQQERQIERTLLVKAPGQYQGHLGSQKSSNQYDSSKVFIVNGIIDKCDANFFRDFNITQVPNTNLFFGPYPQSQKDLQEIQQHKINVIMNLQTEKQMIERGQDWSILLKQFKANGIIQAVHFPVDDMSENYLQNIFEGAQRLFEIIQNKNLRVFVNCSSGITRSPTIILATLSIYKLINQWRNVPEANKFLKQANYLCLANLNAIQQVIHDNKDFQDRQLDPEAEEIARIKKDLEIQEENLRLEEAKRKKAEEDARKKAEMHLKQTEEDQKIQLEQYRKELEESQRQRSLRIQEEQKIIIQMQKQIEQLKIKQEEQIQKDKIQEEEQVIDFQNQISMTQEECEELRQQIYNFNKQLQDSSLEHEKEVIDLNILIEQERQLVQQLREENQGKIDELDLHLRAKIEEEMQALIQLQPEIEQLQEKKRLQIEAQNAQKKKDWETSERQRSQKVKSDHAEKLRQLSKQQQQDQQFNGNLHYVQDYDWFQVSEAEIEQQCDLLFSETPIYFNPRKGNLLEEKIAQIIEEQQITIPILHIKDKLYLIGPNRLSCEIKSGNPMILVGGGYQRFDVYVPKNHRQFQKKLVSYMINNKESLEWVLQQLLDGKQILQSQKLSLSQNLNQESYQSPTIKKSKIKELDRNKLMTKSVSPNRFKQNSSERTESVNYALPQKSVLSSKKPSITVYK